ERLARRNRYRPDATLPVLYTGHRPVRARVLAVRDPGFHLGLRGGHHGLAFLQYHSLNHHKRDRRQPGGFVRDGGLRGAAGRGDGEGSGAAHSLPRGPRGGAQAGARRVRGGHGRHRLRVGGRLRVRHRRGHPLRAAVRVGD
ncbi:MAG: putative membrane protein, partial [uncultured Rubrobacteraceae bacterium]